MSRLRDRVHAAGREDGFMMVIVMIVLLIGLGFAMAGLSSALDSRTNANRDTRVRRAQQAADAGIQATLYQMSQADLGSTSYNFNGGLLGLSTLLDCVVPKVATVNGTVQLQGLVSVSAFANTSGVCPRAVTGNSNASAVPYKKSLGNHTYAESEIGRAHV